jgi:lysyl-tRNA synthetase class 1
LPKRLNSAVWHIHDGAPPKPESAVSFSMLLNLVSVCHSADPGVIWHYISRYSPGAMPETLPATDRLVRFAIRYFENFVLPAKQYRKASAEEKKALQDLRDVLAGLPPGAPADEIQTQVYEVGKRHPCFAQLRDWFAALYQILLGQDSGPRMGSFIALYGIGETIALLDRAIAGEDLSGAG